MKILHKYWLARAVGLWVAVFVASSLGVILAMTTILQRTGTRMPFGELFRPEMLWAYALLSSLGLVVALFADPKLRFVLKIGKPI